jgi:hypothetical protein
LDRPLWTGYAADWLREDSKPRAPIRFEQRSAETNKLDIFKMIIRFLKNAVFVVGAVLLLGSLPTHYLLINSFITNPTSADVTSGQTVPYEVKGKTVYIAEAQKAQTTAVLVGEIAGFLILLVYGALFVYRR